MLRLLFNAPAVIGALLVLPEGRTPVNSRRLNNPETGAVLGP
jgi:hypothetical protein